MANASFLARSPFNTFLILTGAGFSRFLILSIDLHLLVCLPLPPFHYVRLVRLAHWCSR